MLFLYKARAADGTLVTGKMEGSSAIEIKHALSAQGLIPTSVVTEGVHFDLKLGKIFGKKKAHRDLINFTKQFAALFKAGVPVDRILTTLAKQTASPDFKAVILQIRDDIAGGLSLLNAFKKHPDYFDELYVSMLNVGEEGGVLEKVLGELARIMEKDYRISSNIKSATLYPKIVLTVFSLVTTLMLLYVIPRFADFYGGFHSQLPLPTRILVKASDIFASYWYIVFVIIAALVIIYKRFAATPKGRLIVDKLKFKIPVFGSLTLLAANARFGHLVSALYASGLPISRALGIVGGAVGNKAYKNEVDKVKDDVEMGASMAASMEKGSYFSPLMTVSVSVGEQSGALGEMMETTASFYDEEVNDMLEKLTTLIEPLLLVGLFAMVGLLALAIFLPMWNVTKLVLTNS